MSDLTNQRVMLALTEEPIDESSISDFVTLPNCGSQLIFRGLTRDHSSNVEGVVKLEYTAYEDQVVPVMTQVANEMFEKFPIERLAMVHRIGTVELTEAAVVVGVCSPHRQASFEACAMAISELKKRAPIWKKEFTANGESWGDACTH